MWKKEESGFYLRAPHRAHKGRKRSLRDANDSDDGREMGLNKYPATTPRKLSKHFQDFWKEATAGMVQLVSVLTTGLVITLKLLLNFNLKLKSRL